MQKMLGAQSERIKSREFKRQRPIENAALYQTANCSCIVFIAAISLYINGASESDLTLTFLKHICKMLKIPGKSHKLLKVYNIYYVY